MKQKYDSKYCKNCGKTRGNHNAKTFACPVGSQSRAGYTCYSEKTVFEARKTYKKPEKPLILITDDMV